REVAEVRLGLEALSLPDVLHRQVHREVLALLHLAVAVPLAPVLDLVAVGEDRPLERLHRDPKVLRRRHPSACLVELDADPVLPREGVARDPAGARSVRRDGRARPRLAALDFTPAERNRRGPRLARLELADDELLVVVQRVVTLRDRG